MLCIHCRQPAGVIVARSNPEIVFTLTVGGAGVCNDCFWDHVDATIAAIIVAGERGVH